ncbi:histidine kinase dimerization/phosphoacceptor domain-containing protein [Corynebacterium variabile]|uniref:histidine kinase dimerization/phosphoacceptor domain-containing protein n=1 Tax=Corynebacterium variabile TaxID=1727 RepID=UPI00289BDA46|nr:histidine kinase dimerization/phosphoacceptor domain-containing protein [Corynebacterium variabile]
MTTPLARLLETLRLALHLVFAALLVVSLVQFFASDAADASPARRIAVIILTALLAVVYLAGTVAGQTTHGLRRFALPWLTVVLGLWLVLVVLSADAVWLLFPLVFVVLSLTGSVAGALAVVGCWVVAAGVPLITGQRSGVGGVLGPAIGVLFAGLAYWTYLRLTREVEHHRQVAEQLVATRDRLLAAENQAGRLAERERLSREIHDTLAQGFNSVLLLSRAARTAIDQGRTGDATDQLSVITATAHDNLIQTRVLVAEGAEGTESTAAVTATPLAASLRRLTGDAARRARALGRVHHGRPRRRGGGGDGAACPGRRGTAAGGAGGGDECSGPCRGVPHPGDARGVGH